MVRVDSKFFDFRLVGRRVARGRAVGVSTNPEPGDRVQRAGTVLVMVVAMLSMLFIVGTAFLTTVTFESRTLRSALQARHQGAVIDRLSDEVRQSLKRAFLGNDGKPWNSENLSDLMRQIAPGVFVPIDLSNPPDGVPDSPSVTGADRYGEVSGVDPLPASIEPYAPDAQNWYFFSSSDLELSLQGAPLVKAVEDTLPGFPAMGSAGTNLVYVSSALTGPNSVWEHPHPALAGVFLNQGDNLDPNDLLGRRERDEGDSVVRRINATSTSPARRLFRRDADGDGVWDSYEYKLPQDRYPASVRGDLAEQLRADGASGDDIYYALRVIPHGAMVDLNHAHRTLLTNLLGPNPGIDSTNTSRDEADRLVGPFMPEAEEPLLRRRFLLPPRELPLSVLQSPVQDVGQLDYALYNVFDLAPAAPISYRWSQIDTGKDGGDITELTDKWLGEWMDYSPLNTDFDVRHLLTTASHDDNLLRMGRGTPNADWMEVIAGNGANFELDDYPVSRGVGGQNDPQTMGPLNGRLKVNVAAVADAIIEEYNADPAVSPPGLTSHADLLALSAVGTLPARRAYYDRLVRTIHDAFLLMLRNVTNAAAFPPGDDQYMIAAALTANLIDFVDSGDMPTQVKMRTASGADDPAPNRMAYGLERQPFITEVYLDTVTPPFHYAVELHNPYPAEDGGPLSLSSYRIATDVTDPDGTNGQLSMLSTSFLDANAYLAVVNLTGIPGATNEADLASLVMAPGSDSRVRLLLEVNPGEYVVVDEITLPSSSPGARIRDTSNPWFVPVGKDEDAANHTLGTSNSATSFAGLLRPMEFRFVGTGSFASAFPTTGSMLLLGRYANEPAQMGAPGTPFTKRLATGFTQIDNGRMPVFDQSQLAQPAGSDPLALSVPWGQLVFDYFSALPSSHTYVYDPLNPTPADMTPTVDQDGLRVQGRIDINAAPWTVIAGLPLVPADRFSAWPNLSLTIKLTGAAGLDPLLPQAIGKDLAEAIVAYREARQLGLSANYGVVGNRLRNDGAGQAHTGFLTVGELANVRRPLGGAATDIDGGLIDGTPANEDFVRAASRLIALGDWVTTKSHVFTVYGTLRGSGSKSAVDRKAIRFQETVDRLSSFPGNRMPVRIGPRTVGPYAQAAEN